MEQKDKELLFKDLSARLSYGVKILHTGWDSDGDTDFDTVETLIGIDDRFIYTVWDKTGDREKHCLSVYNWKPYLRPMSSMTDEERKEFKKAVFESQNIDGISASTYVSDWLISKHFDVRNIIPKGLALEAPEDMYGR